MLGAPYDNQTGEWGDGAVNVGGPSSAGCSVSKLRALFVFPFLLFSLGMTASFWGLVLARIQRRGTNNAISLRRQDDDSRW